MEGVLELYLWAIASFELSGYINYNHNSEQIMTRPWQDQQGTAKSHTPHDVNLTPEHRQLAFTVYLSAAMMPTMVTAPMIPMSLYLNRVLESCFRMTRCRSSWSERTGTENRTRYTAATREPAPGQMERPYRC